jgi:hypothetical protein
MTTTERIANAIKHILEEDRRADRERIAELERDLNSDRALIANQKTHNLDLRATDEELRATIDDLNRQLDEAHKENARLVMENEVARQMVERRMETISPAPVVEEQGPWVVYDDKNELNQSWCGPGNCWHGVLSSVTPFTDKARAISELSDGPKHWQVITLAEARAIEAKRG